MLHMIQFVIQSVVMRQRGELMVCHSVCSNGLIGVNLMFDKKFVDAFDKIID